MHAAPAGRVAAIEARFAVGMRYRGRLVKRIPVADPPRWRVRFDDGEVRDDICLESADTPVRFDPTAYHAAVEEQYDGVWYPGGLVKLIKGSAVWGVAFENGDWAEDVRLGDPDMRHIPAHGGAEVRAGQNKKRGGHVAGSGGRSGSRKHECSTCGKAFSTFRTWLCTCGCTQASGRTSARRAARPSRRPETWQSTCKCIQGARVLDVQQVLPLVRPLACAFASFVATGGCANDLGARGLLHGSRLEQGEWPTRQSLELELINKGLYLQLELRPTLGGADLFLYRKVERRCAPRAAHGVRNTMSKTQSSGAEALAGSEAFAGARGVFQGGIATHAAPSETYPARRGGPVSNGRPGGARRAGPRPLPGRVACLARSARRSRAAKERAAGSVQ